MPTVMIRVHPEFKKMLLNTQGYIKAISEKEMTMEELTRILATNNGSTGMMAVKFPIILLPEKKVKRNNIPWTQKYLNIVVEDRPR